MNDVAVPFPTLQLGTITRSMGMKLILVFNSRRQGARALVIFSLLYMLIYLLLRLEDDALLIGAISSFLAVASVMYFTRHLDWYSSLSGIGAPDRPLVPPPPTTLA